MAVAAIIGGYLGDRQTAAIEQHHNLILWHGHYYTGGSMRIFVIFLVLAVSASADVKTMTLRQALQTGHVNRVPVIAGAGSNSTREAIELAQHAEKAGADAVLVVTPYYNKPTQEGMYQHFKAINDAIGIPIIIYNISPRSVVDMSVDTMARLFELKNIAGVKDATASMVRVSQQRAQLGDDFNQLSGEDATVIGYMAHGGHGCISVTSNVAPRLCSEFHQAWQKGDHATALKIHDKLMPLHTNLFIESNPAPIKYALSLLGKMEQTLRLPMVPVSEPTRVAVRNAMVHAGLIN